MYKTLVLFFFILEVLALHGQQDSNKNNGDTQHYTKILKAYIKQNHPNDKTDSAFYSAFRYLNEFVVADSISESVERVRQLLKTNKPANELTNLYVFRAKVDSLNDIRRQVLTNYWNRQRLKAIADTGQMSTADSLFAETLDAFFYQDTINIDSLLAVYGPYNDTLLYALDREIDKFSKDTYVQWLKYLRNDTINFYIVNIEGDSLLVRLYKDSPDLIQFSLTNYWGTKIPAVIRDIEKKSFRILVDDIPEINYQTSEKAKSAIGGLGKAPRKKKLTIEPIPLEVKRPVWIYGGNTNIDMSQVGMHQWAQGGDPTISVLGGLELFLNYKKNHKSFENKARFRYGVMRQGRYKEDSIPFRSNEDLMEIASKFGYKAFGQYYVTVESVFKSQFTPNYTFNKNIKGNKISDFMSPAYLTMSLGLDYKPNNKTTMFLSPLTSKITFVLDTSINIKARYSVDSNSISRRELGIRFKGSHKFKFWGNIEMNNSLELFSNYLDRPENVDLNWEMNIVFPVNDFIRATLTTNYIYDDNTEVPRYKINDKGEEYRDDGPGGQFREMITLGFAMKF